MKKWLVIGIILVIFFVSTGIYYFNEYDPFAECLGSAGPEFFINNETQVVLGVNYIASCSGVDDYFYKGVDGFVFEEGSWRGNYSDYSEVSAEEFGNLIEDYNSSCGGCLITKDFILH